MREMRLISNMTMMQSCWNDFNGRMFTTMRFVSLMMGSLALSMAFGWADCQINRYKCFPCSSSSSSLSCPSSHGFS